MYVRGGRGVAVKSELWRWRVCGVRCVSSTTVEQRFVRGIALTGFCRNACAIGSLGGGGFGARMIDAQMTGNAVNIGKWGYSRLLAKWRRASGGGLPQKVRAGDERNYLNLQCQQRAGRWLAPFVAKPGSGYCHKRCAGVSFVSGCFSRVYDSVLKGAQFKWQTFPAFCEVR